MISSLGQVIVALDYEDPALAFSLVEQLGERVSTYKLGPVLMTRSGTEVIQFLHRHNKKIFIDLKLHDTPAVVAHTVSQFAEMGVDFATLHCMGGKKMLEAAGAACRQSRLKLLGVTVLTSFYAEEAKRWGWTHSTEEAVMNLIDVAMEARLAGVLCSPHEIQGARKKMDEGALIVAAGIRLPGKEVYADDQVRFASPLEALGWGADYIVIGRPITQSSDPVKVVEQLLRSS